jgi:hypothetical protein
VNVGYGQLIGFNPWEEAGSFFATVDHADIRGLVTA